MTHRIASLVGVFCLFTSSTAFADHHEDGDDAEYAVNVAGSPFGAAVNFGRHTSEKTTWFAAIGGLPAGTPVSETTLDIDGTEYTVNSSSSYVGFFVNHRPFEGADWFRFNAGIAVGSIENALDDGSGNTFEANYNVNPVGYVGIGAGFRPKKGLIYGLDIGWLQSSGPDISQTGGDADADALDAIADHAFFGNVLPNVQVGIGWGF